VSGVAEASALSVREMSAPASAPPSGLRVSEKVVVGFLAYAVLAAIAFPLSWRERLAVVALNLMSTAVIVWLVRLGEKNRSAFFINTREWFPCVLILLAYRESGLFFMPDPAHNLDYLFGGWDSKLLHNPGVLAVLSAGSPWLQRYLELAYLLCYPLVPLGLGSLTAARRWPGFARRSASSDDSKTVDHFWTAVLLALFCCYVLFPLFPSTPPRSFFHDSPGPLAQSFFRKTNFWILGRYGIVSSVFPSGHVAAVTATALTIRHHLPRLGLVFIVFALSIAVATVYGRYHYAADALAGAVIGIVGFSLSSYLHRQ